MCPLGSLTNGVSELLDLWAQIDPHGPCAHRLGWTFPGSFTVSHLVVSPCPWAAAVRCAVPGERLLVLLVLVEHSQLSVTSRVGLPDIKGSLLTTSMANTGGDGFIFLFRFPDSIHSERTNG